MLSSALTILKRLKGAGYTAYFAGGAVRDFLLGVPPKDIDIATSAKPEEIEKLFQNTKPVGKQFGVILVIDRGMAFDVATFRSDADYKDGRRPEKVTFTSPEEDAKRRDFSINGLFLDVVGFDKVVLKEIESWKQFKRKLDWEVVDFVGGVSDLKKKTLRFIGDPGKRIGEDNLRILRAVRIKNELDLKYDKSTEGAIKKHVLLVKNLSDERVRDESIKGLRCARRKSFFEELSDFGLLRLIIPELDEMKKVEQGGDFHKEGNVFIHTMLAIDAIGSEKLSDAALWALLFHDVGKKETRTTKNGVPHWYNHEIVSAKKAEKIMRRLKFPKLAIKEVGFIIKNAISYDLNKMSKGKRRELFFGGLSKDILDMMIYDDMGKLPKNTSRINANKKYYKEAQKFKLKFQKEYAKYLKGSFVIEVKKIKPGPIVGEIIRKTRLAILDERIKTEKEVIDYIKSIN